MKKSRRIGCEPLESRQLLAGDVCLADAPIERIQDPVASAESIVSLDPIINADFDVLPLHPESLPAIAFPAYSPYTGQDLLAEQEGLVASVRVHPLRSFAAGDVPRATLYLFDRGEDGGLVESAAIDLDFVPRELVMADEMLVVVGSKETRRIVGDSFLFPLISPPFNRTTELLSVSRDDPTVQTRFSIDGMLAGLAVESDRLFLSTSGPIHSPLIAWRFLPNQPMSMFDTTVFDLSGSTVSRIARGDLTGPVIPGAVVGDDILIVERSTVSGAGVDSTNQTTRLDSAVDLTQNVHFIQRLVRYRIDGDAIVRVAELELSDDAHLAFEIADDGKTAVVISRQNLGFPTGVPAGDAAGGEMARLSVFLVDLSQDQPAVFERIDVPTKTNAVVFEIGQRAALIADGAFGVTVVDLDQSIDIAPESRISRIELPAADGVVLVTNITEVTPNQFIVARPLHQRLAENDRLDALAKLEILALSIDDLSVDSQTTLDAATLVVFTPASDQPTLLGLPRLFPSDQARKLAVGSLDSDGQLSLTATIDLAGAHEIDVDAERLLVRMVDHLVEYRWNDLENPVEIPLGEPVPPPTAVDDVFERNADSRERYLDVLANDQFPDGRFGPPQRIVELVGAPEGVSIATGGNVLRLGDAALQNEGTFEFQYVIGEGDNQSTATVTLTLFRFDNADVAAAVDQIVARAGEDLGVDVSEISIGSELRYTSRPMPANFAVGVSNPLAGQYGVVVDLVADGQLIRYAANFSGDVARLNSRTLETVMAIRMRAVDADGNALESIRTGDQFFIEVIAKDVREFGQGIFGVAFDLPIPTNKLELTGDLVLLGKFDDFGQPLTDQGVDEFHAVEVLIDHPGAAAQPVVRIGVKAIGGGQLTLQTDPAEGIGRELLIRGRDDVVSPLEVEFGSLTLEIDGIEPTDTDASGAVTPTDALRVINFLGIYGSVTVDDLPSISGNGEAEPAAPDLVAMRRLDTNADGQITARDALLVINDLARRFVGAEAEPVDMALQSDFLADDEAGLSELL